MDSSDVHRRPGLQLGSVPWLSACRRARAEPCFSFLFIIKYETLPKSYLPQPYETESVAIKSYKFEDPSH